MDRATPRARNASSRDPRARQTEEAVFTATIELIQELGPGGTTIERVAERSGVARSTIYRRWGDVDRLFLDAFDEITRPTPLPLTGDLEGDLRTFARGYVRELNDPAFHDVVMFLMDMAPAVACVPHELPGHAPHPPADRVRHRARRRRAG